MMATILAATDLSEPADEAVRQAHDWAQRRAAELIVCHVIPASHHANPLFPQRNELETMAMVEIEARAADAVTARVVELTGRNADDFKVVIDSGEPDATIIRTAATVNAEITVTGSRGATGLRRLFLGSVARRVARHSHGSVLVARPTANPGCVLAATDLSSPSFPAIVAGAEEARRREARLVVLHNIDLWPLPYPSIEMGLGTAGLPVAPAIDPGQLREIEQHLRNVLARLHVEGDCVITTGAPQTQIVRAAEEQKAGLVVVATHGRTGLARLALGSIAERVVEAAPCSVLVVRLESDA
jgi:nucleotide-binding universal stress UspA family protein